MCAKPNALTGASFSAEDWEKARALYEQLQPWLQSQSFSPQIESADAIDQTKADPPTAQNNADNQAATVAADKDDAVKSSFLRSASLTNAACPAFFFLHQTLLPYLPPAWQKALVWYEAFSALSSFQPVTPPQTQNLQDIFWKALFETLPHA